MPETFNHENYDLVDGDRIVRKADAGPFSPKEDREVMAELTRYVEALIIEKFGFVSISVPEDDGVAAKTSVLASRDWTSASKMLIIIQNASGSIMGIFSRSICIDQGLSKGSMIPYIARAVQEGYAVLILRPNTNSVPVTDEQGHVVSKQPIVGSESPEIHALYVVENILPHAESVSQIFMLGYGNGASLCKDILLRQMVRSKSDGASEAFRFKAVVTIEASHIIEDDDAADFKQFVSKNAVNMECNSAPKGFKLLYREKKLGCASVSLGLPAGQTEIQNVAASLPIALEPAFQFLRLAGSGGSPVATFTESFASANGHDPAAAEVKVCPESGEEDGEPAPLPAPATTARSASPKREGGGFLASVRHMSTIFTGKEVEVEEPVNTKLTVNDFDLLKVVGKGAFGKVMLVRKKSGNGAGNIYAMKVLKKSFIAAVGQIEHTKSERDILFVVRHPFIVRLRFSFQNEEKLFLITDYYNGGCLYSHLRKSKHFSEDRARFYGAELMLALQHLHEQNIIYRDLKLENILMDSVGHIALTDFGLSKQNIDKTGGATTFCGTAEYIAPEVLLNKQYGKAVDWWSFGILVYEMMNGTTPFFEKNRKLMFHRITNREPNFPSTFSTPAIECISKLLKKRDTERLGAGAEGARDIQKEAFFHVIDFKALEKKQVPPPFTPSVRSELDTAYVPDSLLKTEAKDSFSEKDKDGKGGVQFEGFTYKGETALDGL